MVILILNFRLVANPEEKLQRLFDEKRKKLLFPLPLYA